MANDAIALLMDLGKQFGKRVSSANFFDANVCTSPRNPERPWEILALPGDIFRHKLNITRREHKVKLLANSDFFVVQVTENLDVKVCSINRRDVVFNLKQNSLRVPGFSSLPVFSRQSDTELRELLNSGTLNHALNALQLRENESLHMYRNGLTVYLQRGSRDEIMSAVEAACELAKQLPAVDDGLDFARLPPKFESLIGLIPKWALSDDEKRSEMLEKASLEALRSFVASVSPLIPAINEYLDSFGDEPPPEGAVTLGALAECCVEAQIRIRGVQEK